MNKYKIGDGFKVINSKTSATLYLIIYRVKSPSNRDFNEYIYGMKWKDEYFHDTETQDNFTENWIDRHFQQVSEKELLTNY